MGWLQTALKALAFVSAVAVQLEVDNQTPVGGTATVNLNAGQLLEVSEGNEHWEIQSVTAVRVK